METLAQLARLIHQRNALDTQIAELTHRPAYAEPLGKFIAASLFDIRLLRSSAHSDFDGHFLHGELAGHSVKVQWYSRQDGTIDLNPNAHPDEYLVFTGSPSPPTSLSQLTPSWLIERVYLFHTAALLEQLQELGSTHGMYTHVPPVIWDAAEVYPQACSPRLLLSEQQIAVLRLFGAGQDGRLGQDTPEETPGVAMEPAEAVAAAPTPEALVDANPPASTGTAAGILAAAAVLATVEPEPLSPAVPPDPSYSAVTQRTHPPSAGGDQPPADEPPPATAPLVMPSIVSDAPPIAMRRWLTSPPAQVQPLPEAGPSGAGPDQPAAAPDSMPTDSIAGPAASQPAWDTVSSGYTTHDSRASADLPATAHLPPLPPGARFPRPPALQSYSTTQDGGSLSDVSFSAMLLGDVFPSSESPLAPASGSTSAATTRREPAHSTGSTDRTGSVPKKYHPLENHLAALPADVTSLSLTFAQIEAIIDDHLPASALTQQAWWTNSPDTKRLHAHSWLKNGWQVKEVDLEKQVVLLVR